MTLKRLKQELLTQMSVGNGKSSKEADNLMITKVNEIRDRLTEDLATKSNTVFKNISVLDESIREIKNEMILAKDTVDKVVQEELVDEINEEERLVEKLVEDVSEVISSGGSRQNFDLVLSQKSPVKNEIFVNFHSTLEIFTRFQKPCDSVWI